MWLFIFIIIGIAGVILWKKDRDEGKQSGFGLICFIVSLLGIIWQIMPSSTTAETTKMTTSTTTTRPTATAKADPTVAPTMYDKYDDLSEVVISDQSDAGFDTGFGTDHFNISSSEEDNFGNSYINAGYFDWNEYYASEGYVIFYVADYTKVTGQLVAIKDKRPDDNAIIKMYDDDGLIATFEDIGKTTLPVDFSIDLTGKDFLKIYTNSQEIMYVNVEFER